MLSCENEDGSQRHVSCAFVSVQFNRTKGPLHLIFNLHYQLCMPQAVSRWERKKKSTFHLLSLGMLTHIHSCRQCKDKNSKNTFSLKRNPNPYKQPTANTTSIKAFDVLFVVFVREKKRFLGAIIFILLIYYNVFLL